MYILIAQVDDVLTFFMCLAIACIYGNEPFDLPGWALLYVYRLQVVFIVLLLGDLIRGSILNYNSVTMQKILMVCRLFRLVRSTVSSPIKTKKIKILYPSLYKNAIQ